MKFGKRMRSLATPAWDGDYVDYKHLKKTLRVLATEGGSEAATRFHGALEQQMQQLNAAHNRIYSELYDKELRVLRNALGNRWVLSPPQARALLLGVIELSEKVDAFRRYILLNSLAIVKITKKFDKLFAPAELKTTVMEDLKCQPFYDGASMDKLCAATSALTDRVMLCILPDGNFRISEHKVSCPICLQSEVKSAITLSCKHTFCWSCLSKAAEHRFHSCPMCRKEQSIDPRDYAVDGLLMRFKRAYDFVEDAVDRAPFASSPMRQILIEGFDFVNGFLRGIEAQYAALSPRPSLTMLAVDVKSDVDGLKPVKQVVSGSPTAVEEVVVRNEDDEMQHEKLHPFNRGDAVEVHYNGHWYAGMVLHENDDNGASYSVLWWMHDQSQRCGQRMARHLLRLPVFPDQHPSQYMLFDFAAGAWKTATEWALMPFRRLRSLSMSDTSSVQGNSSAA